MKLWRTALMLSGWTYVPELLNEPHDWPCVMQTNVAVRIVCCSVSRLAHCKLQRNANRQ